MSSRSSLQRWIWLTTGLVAGLCIATIWPHEPTQASTADRDAKFGMCTCPVSFTDGTEGFFVLDYLTGRLQGAMLNPKVNKFTNFYYRNLAADFSVDPQADPHYVMVSGRLGQALGRGIGGTRANGVLYIGELTSGKVVAYGFTYSEVQKRLPPRQIAPLDVYQFREPLIRE